MRRHPNFLLLGLIAPVVAWSAWEPYDHFTWWLEVIPEFLGFIALFIAQVKSGWRFSNRAMGLNALHMIVLLVGIGLAALYLARNLLGRTANA